MKKILKLFIADRFKSEKSPYYYLRTNASECKEFQNVSYVYDYKTHFVLDFNDGVWITMGMPQWKYMHRTFKVIE